MKKNVITPDYSGTGRRKEDMKINNDILYRIGYAILIGVMVLGVYRTRFEAMGVEQKAQACEIKSQGDKIAITEKDVISLKTEIPNIKEGIIEIKTSQVEMRNDIKLLLRQSRIQ